MEVPRRPDADGRSTIDFDGNHQVTQADGRDALAGHGNSSLPTQYTPHVWRYQRLVRTARELEERNSTVVPWHRDMARYVGASTYLKKVSPLFGYFWLSWKEAHGATMFLLDLALLIYTFMLLSEVQKVGFHEISTAQIADAIGAPLYLQVAFPITTWIFGYIGPRESTYTAHVTVAGVRVVACIICFALVYLRRNFGVLHWAAIRLVFVLFLAALAHLIGAWARAAHFARQRAKALSNPSNRRVHQGTGFMTAYLSLEDQEKQKAAARVRVGIHESYAQTLDAYWHCPTPEVDVQHNVYTDIGHIKWWRKLWMSRTRLQQHVKRVSYMRQWPLNFATTELLHSDLFASCDCCLDTDELPKPLPIRPEHLRRMRARREAFISRATNVEGIPGQHSPPPGNEEQPHGRLDETMSDLMLDLSLVPLHQLCERCEALCCESILLALLVEPDMSRFWRHVKAAFTFTQTGPLLEEMFLLWDSAAALRKSATHGCHLCSMLWNSLSPLQQAALVREVNSFANLDYPKELGVFVKILSPHAWQPGRPLGEDPYGNLYLVTHFGPRRVPRFWMEQKFVLRAQSLGTDPSLEHPELLPPVRICLTDPTNRSVFAPPSGTPSTGSPAAMEFVMSWLSAHQHSDPTVTDGPMPCTETAVPRAPTRPKRLLEITPGERVRLLSDMHPTHTAPYAALSYCWHSTNNRILEVATLPLYTDGVAINELPRTLQDALRVIQNLSFNYIWIDALCIIQDSEDDKMVQLKDMQGIYAGAAFVIAAAAALDASQGFLVNQMPHVTSACFLDLNCVAPRTASGHQQIPATGSAIVALPCQKFANAAEDELSLSRLRSRGWVYQEEELAARVLYFCDRQLVLRCNLCRKTAVQQYLPPASVRRVPNTVWAGSIPILSTVTSALQRLKALLSRNRSGPLGNSKMESHRIRTCISGQLSSLEGRRFFTEGSSLPSTQQERWWTLVGEYSARHLSYGADKLPAIQGLADRVEAELLASRDGDTHPDPVSYVLGLWSGAAFGTGLLWYVKDGVTVRPHPRAPSWSWAAVDGVIRHDSLAGDTNSDMCGVTVLKLPDSQDRRLVLKAMIRPATWHRAPTERKLYYVGHRRHGTVRFQYDLGQYEPLTTDLTQGPEAQILQDLSGGDVGYLMLDSESDLRTAGSEIYCLRIVVKPTTRSEERDFNVPWATRGIALVEDSDEPGTFRRIGYFELQRTPGGISYQSSMNPARQKAERHPPPNIDVAGFYEGCEATAVTLV